jgi:hypothetical protein
LFVVLAPCVRWLVLADVFPCSLSWLTCSELLRQLRAAATAIGNAELQDKFEEGTRLLKHGIIFAGSLYL